MVSYRIRWVGWVERSETQQNQGLEVGFRSSTQPTCVAIIFQIGVSYRISRIKIIGDYPKSLFINSY